MIIKGSLRSSKPPSFAFEYRVRVWMELEGLKERPPSLPPLPHSVTPLSSRVRPCSIWLGRQNPESLHSPLRFLCVWALASFLASFLFSPISLPKLQFPRLPFLPSCPPAFARLILRMMPSSITPRLSKSKVENKIALLVRPSIVLVVPFSFFSSSSSSSLS